MHYPAYYLERDMQNIKRVSFGFKILFQVLLLILPILFGLSWIYAPEPYILLGGLIRMEAIPHSYSYMYYQNEFYVPALTLMQRGAGLLLSLIPLVINLTVLIYLTKLFTLYTQGQIFSNHHVRYLRNIGYALLCGQLIRPFYEFLMGLILTWYNPPGHRFAAMTFDQTNFGIIITAFLIILISWIMSEGQALQEQQQLTI